jgi:transposase InsO family protein
MGVPKAQHYTREERARAVALARTIGDAAAALELGIPKGTMSSWSWKARNGELPGCKGGEALDAVEVSGSLSGPMVASVANPSKVPPGSKQRQRVRRVAKVYTPSQRAEALEYAAEHGMEAAHKKFGMSRRSLYDWERKVRLAAEGKAIDSPVSGPDTDPRVDRDRRILAVWKKHAGLGPSQIRNQLHRHHGMKTSVNTVRRVMEENGYVPPKVKKKSMDKDDRFESVRPNHMWHMDFLHRYVHKLKVYVLLIIDDFSRYIVGHALWDGEKAEVVLSTFGSAVSRYGKPEWLMSDGGSAFYAWRGISQFTRSLEDLGCDQLIAKTPNVNGKSEALNANIQKELFDVDTFFDLHQAKRQLDAWVSFYNLRRTHHALGGLLVPADRYFGRADEVLSAIEMGRSPEGVGMPLSPEERLLDLLKVTSEKGVVAVTLMGNRIWPPGA